jgi:hypothetical protein
MIDAVRLAGRGVGRSSALDDLVNPDRETRHCAESSRIGQFEVVEFIATAGAQM